MSLIRQFAIRNELLYSGFVLPNVQIFFVQKISFATFGVSIDDFFTRYAGLGYSLYDCSHIEDVHRRRRSRAECDRAPSVVTVSLNIFYLINSLHVYKQEHTYNLLQSL